MSSDLKDLILESVSTLRFDKTKYTKNDLYEFIVCNMMWSSMYYNIKSTTDLYVLLKSKMPCTRRMMCAISFANECNNVNIFDRRWNRKRELMLVFQKGKYSTKDFNCSQGGCLKKMIGNGILSGDNIPRIIFGYL